MHERRIAVRRTVTPGPGGSVSLRVVLPDFAGADAVGVRAYGPRGESRRASALLA